MRKWGNGTVTPAQRNIGIHKESGDRGRGRERHGEEMGSPDVHTIIDTLVFGPFKDSN